MMTIINYTRNSSIVSLPVARNGPSIMSSSISTLPLR